MMERRRFIQGSDLDLSFDLPQNELVYLASPYSDPSIEIRRLRFDSVCYAAAEMMNKGFYVYSPIVNNHPLVDYGVKTNWKYWKLFDEIMINKCSVFAVLMLDGWYGSTGVRAEIKKATEIGRYVHHILPWFRPAYGLEPSPKETERS